jgi:hypothetical protein
MNNTLDEACCRSRMLWMIRWNERWERKTPVTEGPTKARVRVSGRRGWRSWRVSGRWGLRSWRVFWRRGWRLRRRLPARRLPRRLPDREDVSCNVFFVDQEAALDQRLGVHALGRRAPGLVRLPPRELRMQVLIISMWRENVRRTGFSEMATHVRLSS